MPDVKPSRSILKDSPPTPMNPVAHEAGKDGEQPQWDHLRSNLTESMKSWLELEETLRGTKSTEEIKLEEMKSLIQRIQDQLKDFK